MDNDNPTQRKLIALAADNARLDSLLLRHRENLERKEIEITNLKNRIFGLHKRLEKRENDILILAPTLPGFRLDVSDRDEILAEFHAMATLEEGL